MAVLNAIARGNVVHTTIMHGANVSGQSFTKLLNDVLFMNLVNREPCTFDGRIRFIYALTIKGERAVKLYEDLCALLEM